MTATFTQIRGNCGSGETCEAIHATSRRTAIVTGREVTDPAERALLPIGPGETAVEVSLELLSEATRS